MTNEIKLITPNLMKSWNACRHDYNKFCEFFPEGEDLKKAVNILMKNGHHDLARWLFNQFLAKGLFEKVVAKDDSNIGVGNTGCYNSGDGNTGHNNSGSWNKGNGNAGAWNIGYYNIGNGNIGSWNEGSWNIGNDNSGDDNMGDYNVGNGNTGHRNTGSHNVGSWNTGDSNLGYFNTITSDEFSIFNKPCKKVEWKNAYKPWFLHFRLFEKNKDYIPDFSLGVKELKVFEYKEAFKKSWDKSDPEDRIRIKELPNFDAEIFFEISGIDLR